MEQAYSEWLNDPVPNTSLYLFSRLIGFTFSEILAKGFHTHVRIFLVFLAGVACFGFGAFHVTGLYGPGIWVSDPYGLTGKVQAVNPAWGAEGSFRSGRNSFASYCCGYFGHISGPIPSKCPSASTSIRMGNIETVLSSSIAAVFFLLLLPLLLLDWP